MAELETIELDTPDPRDYMYEDLFGSSYNTETVEFLPINIQNQSDSKNTRMACSRYGICHAINAQNEYVKWKDGMRYYVLPAKFYWEEYLKVNPKAEQEGATLQSALDQMKKLWYITGYTKVVDIDQMKNALNNIRPLFTGSKKCNWNSVRDDKIYAFWEGYAHIFCIVGYDHSGWIAINSYGSENGRFIIPYEFTDSLFSVYAISDSRDEEILRKV